MQKSKLILLLRKLDSRTHRRFLDYILSPYFNKHAQLQALGQYIIALSPHFEHPRKLEKQKVFKAIYPNRTYDNAALHRLTSQFLQLLHDFLALEHWQEMPNSKTLSLMEILRKHKSYKDYSIAERTYIKQRGKQEGTKARARLLYQDYQFHRELDYRFIDQGGRQYDENLQLQNNYLDEFFILEKLKIACDMASRNIVIKANYNPTMIHFILKYMDENEDVVSIISKIYRQIYAMRTTQVSEDEQHYQQLKKLLQQSDNILTDEERKDVYRYALNYAIQQINRGRSEYYRESFEHYRFLIEQKLVFLDGYLPSWDYKNIVTIALPLEEFEWTQQFIEKYKQFLNPDVRENAYTYNSASYFYAVGNYGRALQVLHDVEFLDTSYALGAKIIQVKCYYELEESETFFSLIESFKMYLHRNKNISEYRKQASVNFLKLSKKLLRLREQKALIIVEKFTQKYKQLEDLLKTTSPVANKLWIEKSLEKLVV